MNEETINKIREHYEHACTKHPYFCDYIDRLSVGIFADKENNLILTEKWLKDVRQILKKQIEGGFVNALTVLDCEVREFEHAVIRGENEHAVEECYDAIAVLLRVVDVLEGRQKLGNPEGGAK